MPRSPARDIAFFVALVATAMALGGALAHAFAFPNKIGMSANDYFVVQRIYLGWNRLAAVLAVQLIAIIAVVWLDRAEQRVLWPALVALAGLVAAQAVFWLFTFPANEATSNWSVRPADWETLRRQWEYSHLAGAGFQLLAFLALTVAVLRRAR
jgi:hypothetical protein